MRYLSWADVLRISAILITRGWYVHSAAVMLDGWQPLHYQLVMVYPSNSYYLTIIEDSVNWLEWAAQGEGDGK